MPTPIDTHLKKFTGPQRSALDAVLVSLRALLPTATEGISWGMPTFFVDGIGLIGFEGFKAHNSVFPMSGGVPKRLAKELAGYQIGKGTIQFAFDKPMPKPLLRKIVLARIEELNDSFPRKDGVTKSFYDNGTLAMSGRMKGNQMNGAWKWYRRDGSLMRTGSFKNGEQTGTWTTYAADGRVVKVTEMSKAAPAKKTVAKKTTAKKAAPKKVAIKKSVGKKAAPKVPEKKATR